MIGYTRQADGSWLSDKPSFLISRGIDGRVFEPPLELYTRITDPQEQARELGQAIWEAIAPLCGEVS